MGILMCSALIARQVWRRTTGQHRYEPRRARTEMSTPAHTHVDKQTAGGNLTTTDLLVKLLCAVCRRADAVRVARQRKALLVVQCLGLVGQQGLLVQVDLQDGRHRSEHRRTYPESFAQDR
jgi:hypothetical protein